MSGTTLIRAIEPQARIVKLRLLCGTGYGLAVIESSMMGWIL
jgi:hypothetical protein